MVYIFFSGNAVALLQKQTCTPHITVIEIGKCSKQGVKCHGSTVELSEVLLGKSLVEQQLAVAWQQFQRAVIILNSLGQPPTVLTGHTTHLIGIRDEGIPLNRSRGILFRSQIILQIQFGNGTHEIWLCQIWLGHDCLIEILDGHHVIIEIQCILTHAQHLLGINLRMAFPSAGKSGYKQDCQYCNPTPVLLNRGFI